MAPTTSWSEAVRHGQHACGIVGSGPERLRMVSGFVRSGLLAGDRVWCFANGSRSEILGWLRRDQVVENDALDSGQLTVLPTHESALCFLESDPDAVVDGLRRAVDDALDDGWNGFRMVGDLGWATREQCCPQHLIDFEERIGEVLAGSPAATLCQYDRYRFDVATMVTLTGMHAAVLGSVQVGEQLTCCPLDGLLRLDRPPGLDGPQGSGLRLVGEVDLATREVFTTALDEAMSGTGDLHLDLSELTFIDIGGVQVMLSSAERMWPSRRIILHWSPPSLKIALHVLCRTHKLIDAEGESA
ncbi:MAG: MEDS domain-containing protein [Pseudonocardiales bacterium]